VVQSSLPLNRGHHVALRGDPPTAISTIHPAGGRGCLNSHPVPDSPTGGIHPPPPPGRPPSAMMPVRVLHEHLVRRYRARSGKCSRHYKGTDIAHLSAGSSNWSIPVARTSVCAVKTRWSDQLMQACHRGTRMRPLRALDLSNEEEDRNAKLPTTPLKSGGLDFDLRRTESCVSNSRTTACVRSSASWPGPTTIFRISGSAPRGPGKSGRKLAVMKGAMPREPETSRNSRQSGVRPWRITARTSSSIESASVRTSPTGTYSSPGS
jgi:hypothetical protein